MHRAVKEEEKTSPFLPVKTELPPFSVQQKKSTLTLPQKFSLPGKNIRVPPQRTTFLEVTQLLAVPREKDS